MDQDPGAERPPAASTNPRWQKWTDATSALIGTIAPQVCMRSTSSLRAASQARSVEGDELQRKGTARHANAMPPHVWAQLGSQRRRDDLEIDALMAARDEFSEGTLHATAPVDVVRDEEHSEPAAPWVIAPNAAEVCRCGYLVVRDIP